MKLSYPLRPDSKGRACSSHFAEGAGSDHLTTEIPLQEAWLFRNKEALRSVRRGLKQFLANQVKDAGSFSQYIEG